MKAFHEQWNKLKGWWAGLAVREQQAVALGGGLLTLFLFYVMIWSPYLTHIDTMRKHISSAQKTLAWMQSEDVQIKTMEKQSAPERKSSVTPVTLLSYLQKQLSGSGLAPALSEMKQSSSDAVEMHFQKVSFDRLIVMLTEVLKAQSVSITQMTVVADAAPGLVKADIVLKID